MVKGTSSKDDELNNESHLKRSVLIWISVAFDFGYIGEDRNSPLNARFPGMDPSVSDRVKNQTWAVKSDHIIDVIQKLSSLFTK
ncbi:hypothetical protein AMTR_s00099p00167340, partial [Amborella trichopoda]